jgi:hypothetical protein
VRARPDTALEVLLAVCIEEPQRIRVRPSVTPSIVATAGPNAGFCPTLISKGFVTVRSPRSLSASGRSSSGMARPAKLRSSARSMGKEPMTQGVAIKDGGLQIGPYRHRRQHTIHRVDAVRSYDGRNTAASKTRVNASD